MDTAIALTGCISFLFLLGSLLVVFRRVEVFAAVAWYIRIAVLFGICEFLTWNIVCMYGLNIPIGSDAYIEGSAASLLIYGLLAVLFLFGIFGTLESSVTLRLLAIIAGSGKEGIHQNAIISSYNRRSIVTRRLARLLWSKEVVLVGKYYRLSKKASYSVWREYFFRWMEWIFPYAS